MKITINYTYKQSIKRVTYLKSIFLTKDDRQWVDSKVLPDQEDTPKRQGFSLYCLHLNVDGWYAKLQLLFPRQVQLLSSASSSETPLFSACWLGHGPLVQTRFILQRHNQSTKTEGKIITALLVFFYSSLLYKNHFILPNKNYLSVN